MEEADGSWTIVDRRTGEPVEKSGLVLSHLNPKAILGLVQILEMIEDAPRKVH